MKKALIYGLLVALLGGCRRGSDDSLQRKQQQYDAVQEGQTSSGVTTTINAPGEVAAPIGGMTNTNADTTTNFTLPQVSSTAPPRQGRTLAGTMTIQGTAGPLTGDPSAAPVRRRPRPAVRTTTSETTTTTSSQTSTAPATATPPAPPARDTAPPPEPTDTAPPPSTTTTG